MMERKYDSRFPQSSVCCARATQANTAQMLLTQLSEHPDLIAPLAALGTAPETLVLGPCHAASHAYLLTTLCRFYPQKTFWVIHESPRLRERIAAEMECWGQSTLTLPEPAADLVDGTIADPEAEAERMQVFELLSQAQRAVIHTHSSALLAAAPDALSLQNARLVLEK